MTIRVKKMSIRVAIYFSEVAYDSERIFETGISAG